MYRFKTNDLPRIFAENFSRVSNERYKLRSESTLSYKTPVFKKQKSDFSIFFRGPTTWNNFNEPSIKEAKNLSTFKYLTKKNLLSGYV